MPWNRQYEIDTSDMNSFRFMPGRIEGDDTMALPRIGFTGP